MTYRECYKRIALFEKPEYIPNIDSLPKPRLREEWTRQGCPADLDLHEYFGLERKPEIVRRVNYGPVPGLSEDDKEARRQQALAEHPKYRDYHNGCDSWGRVGAWQPEAGTGDWAEGARHVLKGALEDPADWEKIKDQFEPRLRDRYGYDDPKKPWEQFAAEKNGVEHPMILEAPSMVGSVKEQLGFENYCMKLFDNLEMILEINQKRTELALEIMGHGLETIEFDFIWFWEDIGFRNGPILSPEMFEKVAVPFYKRIADWYRARGGQIVAVDSDGDVNALIPGWIRGGINHIWPLEPFAGMDVVALRKEYGQAFSMRGGIDKFCVGKGREEIDRELDRIFPVVQEGGYLPHLDHMLPRCTFEDYCYYMERKKEMLAGV